MKGIIFSENRVLMFVSLVLSLVLLFFVLFVEELAGFLALEALRFEFFEIILTGDGIMITFKDQST